MPATPSSIVAGKSAANFEFLTDENVIAFPGDPQPMYSA